MSDRWVSQGRRFCKFCNCWFADNKIVSFEIVNLKLLIDSVIGQSINSNPINFSLIHKQSVDNHEKGASHIANVDKELSKTRQTKLDLEAAERAMQLEMQKIEAAAMKSFEEDVKRDQLAREEMERIKQGRKFHLKLP